MYLYGLFRKRLSVKQGEELLTEYCKINGFGDDTTQWKKPKHSTHLFSYQKRLNRKIATNWVSFHHIRGNDKYSIWIDLVSEEITEILR